MKYLPPLIAIVVIAAFAWYANVWGGSQTDEVGNAADAPSEEAAPAQQLKTKVDIQADVTVEVTPLDLSPTATEWRFEVVMDTHSVELTDDLVALSTLRDERGSVTRPLRWEGDPPGGHHRGGTLIFSPNAPLPASIELRISGIGGVERKFSWQW